MAEHHMSPMALAAELRGYVHEAFAAREDEVLSRATVSQCILYFCLPFGCVLISNSMNSLRKVSRPSILNSLRSGQLLLYLHEFIIHRPFCKR
jgi:hypothetical protein